jgi:serine/threonine protein phosphatase 1
MADRTFVIGDLHGDLPALRTIVNRLPDVRATDTLVFLGDYVDRGPASSEVIRVVRALGADLGCKVVTLRGNHEDAWLRVIDERWDEFVFPPGNGCLAAMRSFTGGAVPAEDEMPTMEEKDALFSGSFFPADVVSWMRELPWWYEDEHALYVHAGLPSREGQWLHPKDVEPRAILLWLRSEDFFTSYDGKRVVVGHTTTDQLPQELSGHTPADPTDMFVSGNVVAIDTGAGKGGFLTCVELPSLTVYESR